MAGKRRPRRMAEFPAAARLILEDYHAFLAGGSQPPDEAASKAFAAHHAAARAALAHLEQLLKLAAEADDADLAQEVSATLSQWRALMPPQAPEDREADDPGAGG